MGKVAVFLLMALAFSGVAAAAAAAAGPGLPARRSRFLATSNSPYDCSKKSAAACLAPGSPGATCCGGRCVDATASSDHCGGCNKACRDGRTCCGGRCVDLLSDKDNCGTCSNQCRKKCNHGFCDYA